MSEPKITSLESLRFDESNSNLGTDRGRKALRHSLETLGAGRSILVSADDVILAGNKTAAEAVALGHEDVILVETDGTKLVAVKRTDLLSDSTEARTLAVADNRIAELDLSWSPEAIAAQLDGGLDLSALWTGDELEELLRGLQEPGAEPLTDPDAIPEDVETRCKPGELWSAGRHRMWVGDCTDAAGVARLLDGKRLRLVWTDPPYGVGYQDNESLESLKARNRRTDGKVVSNDSLTEAQTETLCRSALALSSEHGEAGAACYVACPAGTPLPHFIAAVADSGFQYRHSLIWVKDQFVFGRCDYHYRHEVILYGWLPGVHYFADDRTQDSVFEIPRPKASEEHPTMKPVELVERMVKNSSRAGDLVYDPFLGSGTTLIACEATGRTCFGCEIDAQYASVVLARWEAVSGQVAHRLS